MAHRGRLNVLVNTLGKSPAELFSEFDHSAPENLPSGDVKYHQGFSSDVSTPGGPVHLSLAFNPSHLEIVNPVVEGSVKARLDRRGDKKGRSVLPIIVHGDAAFAGQGVVMETLALAQTRGYYTGGTVHVVINNQIGFTTSDPRDTRSTLYCTDVVKMVEAPVLHVNGDDPEAVVLATQLVLDYRQEFNKDVVVDIVCFRKLGHNEQDTPALTQPLMYKKIAQHQGTRRLYGEKLVAQGVLPADGPDQMVKEFRAAMDAGKHTIDPVLTNYKSKYAVDWAPFLGKKWTDAADTALPLAEIKRLAERITTLPAELQGRIRWSRRCWPTARRWVAARSMSTGAWASTWRSPRWWPAAIRCACRARTAAAAPSPTAMRCCTTRTASSWDEGTYTPLQHVAEGQAPFVVIDSLLSEEAVLGFEYGYAVGRAEYAGDLGSAVRRLRQRRAGRDRPVHRVGRSQVGPGQRPDADAAARLRRAGPGAQLGAPRALHAAGRRQQHADRAADHGEPDLPCAAAPDGAHVPQAAGADDAEVAAASQGCRLAADRVHARRVPHRDPRDATPSWWPTRSSG